VSDEIQYLQTQLNALQETIASHQVLVADATVKIGENKKELKEVNAKIVQVKAALVDIKTSQMSKVDFELILETTFNRGIVATAKRILFTSVSVSFAAGLAWLINHLSAK